MADYRSRMTTEAATTNHNATEYSVSEISAALKRVVEDRFGYVRVRGEISGLKVAASGHAYLSLKDDKSVLSGVCWKGTMSRLSFRPEDGLEIIATGKLTTYPGRSNYQIVIERMEHAGAGALMALLEKRKKELAAEGLFDPARKKPLPYLPQVIGVITSPTGAVIRDILHRLSDRFPVHVLVWPVLVQGDGAANQVAEAVAGMNALTSRPDVLIVARGGGSIEDLWPFNEEVVVRAVVASEIPVISAVGHETDTTLIDYVSDQRAPTPTAAAEMAVPVLSDLRYTIGEYGQRLDGAVANRLERHGQRLEGLARGLPKPQELLARAEQDLDRISERHDHAIMRWFEQKRQQVEALGARLPHPRDRLAHMAGQLVNWTERLDGAWQRQMRQWHEQVQSIARQLDLLDYHKVLERGFALVRDGNGALVSSVATAEQSDGLVIRFKDGDYSVGTGGAVLPKAEAPRQQARKLKAKQSGNPNDQGSLF